MSVEKIVIPASALSVIGERPSVMVALLKRMVDEKSRYLPVTFDELATDSGYANRSGVWKYVRKLEKCGLVTKLGRGLLHIDVEVMV